MADDTELSFVVQLKNEASAALKDLQAQITAAATAAQGLEKAHTGASAAVGKHTTATKESSAQLREASYAARLLSTAHSELATKLQEGARFLGGFGEVLGEIGPMGIAAAGVLGLIGERALKSVEAFAEFEYQGVKLNATLKAIGESGKVSLEELEQAAQKVGATTLFNPEEVIAGGVQISRVIGLTGDQITSLLPKLADMAAYMGTNIPAAASMLTRMLQNPTQGIMFLTRVTRDVTTAEREHVQQLMASGDVEGARQVILDNLSRKTKDYAAELTGGLSGAYQDMKNQLGIWANESEKSFGRMIASALHLEAVYRAVADAARNSTAASIAAQETTTPLGRAQFDMENANAALERAQAGDERGVFTKPLAAYFPGLAPTYEEAQKARNADAVKAAEKARNQAQFEMNSAFEQVNDLTKMGITPYGRGVYSQSAGRTLSSNEVNNVESNTQKLMESMDPLIKEQERLKDAEANLRLQVDIDRETDSAALGRHLEMLNAVTEAGKALKNAFEMAALTAREAAQMAGMTAGDQAYQKQLETFAKAQAQKVEGKDANWRNYLGDTGVQYNAKVARQDMIDAQTSRAQKDYEADWGLTKQSLQPGLPGQVANAQLELQRWQRSQESANGGVGPTADQMSAKWTELTQKLLEQNKIENQKFYEQQVLTTQTLQTQLGLMQDGTGNKTQDLAAIMQRESRGQNVMNYRYKEDPSKYTASGYYQITDTTWKEGMKLAGVAGFQTAISAPKDVQTQVAGALYDKYGMKPWAASAPGRGGVAGAAGMSEPEAKMIADATKLAQERANEGLGTFSDNLAQILPQMQQQLTLNNQLQLVAQARKTHDEDLVTQATLLGGALAGAAKQAELEARAKGMNPQQTAAAVRLAADQRASTFKSQTGNAAISAGDETELKNMQAGISMMSDMDQEIRTQILLLHQRATAAGVAFDDATVLADEQAIRNLAQATERLKEAQGPLAQYVKDSADSWKTFQDMGVTALDDIGSAMGDLATGTTNLHDALTKVIQDLAKMAAQAAFKSIAGSLLSTAGTALGGLFGGSSPQGMSATGGVSMAANGGLYQSGGIFAMGGIMTPYGPMALHRYAGGGVANSPQLAVFGEGRGPEAYVPLPDGRSIPVSMRGGGGSNMQNNFNVTVNAGNQGGQNAQNPADIGNAVAASLRNMVVEVMHDQRRAGGALNPLM